MNKFIVSVVLGGAFFAGSLVWAENDSRSVPSPTHVPASASVRAKMQAQKDQLKQNIKNIKTSAQADTRAAKVDLKNTTDALKEDAKKRREEFNETLKTRKEKLEEEIKNKREELKVRLEKIKDERKKETVEKIDQRMDALNEKMMRHFSNVLDKLEEMLIRIGERADKAATERGLDVSAVRLAIGKANTAIASARSAIETQSAKTYSIKVASETTLRADVGKSRQALGADLAKVKDAVKNAHSAVRDAAVALAQLVVKPSVSPTPSPSESPSPSASPNPTPTE